MKKKVFFVIAVLIITVGASINVAVDFNNKQSSVLRGNIEALSGIIKIFGCCASEGSICAVISSSGGEVARDNQQPCLIEITY